MKSQDAGLQNLVSNVGVWNKDFTTEKLEGIGYPYTINVVNGVQSIELTPTAAEGSTITAAVASNGQTKTQVLTNNVVNTINLSNATTTLGTTTIQITVVAPDQKTSKNYSVQVVRAAATASNDGYATAITATGTGGAITFDTAFKSTKSNYVANVGSGVTTATFTVTATGKTVYINGANSTDPVQLKPGKNTIEIKVVAEDNSTSKVYTYEIVRANPNGSTINTLNSLTLSAGTLGGFTADTAPGASLTTVLPNTVNELTITPVATVAGASVSVTAGHGTSSASLTDLEVVKSGSSYNIKGLKDTTAVSGTTKNFVTITVTPENGAAAQVYTLEITRAKAIASDVAQLVDITGLEITPAIISGTTPASSDLFVQNPFKSSTTDYSFNVANNADKLGAVVATPVSGGTVSYKVNGVEYQPGASAGQLATAPLKIGANNVEIKVTSANALNSRTYKVTINRADLGASEVKTLNSITTANGTITGFTADEAAPAAGLKVNVPNATTEFTFKPAATHAKATVSVTAAKASTNTSVSSTPTDKLEVVKNADGSFTVKGLQTLSSISNVAVITVTAEDASTDTYKLQIDRAVVSASDNALLSSFSYSATTTIPVSGSAAGVTFTGTTANITIPSTQNVVFIKPTAAGTSTTILVDGKSVDSTGVSAPIALAVGETKAVVIKVTAANGTTTKEYTVNVKRAVENASEVNTLSGLTVSAGLLNGFVASAQVNDDAVALDTTVPAATENLTITPALKDAGSTVSVVASTGGSYDATKALTVEKSGDAYTIKGLVGGSTANTVVITVTSASGAKKAYTLKVTRAIDGVSTESALANADAGLKLESLVGSTATQISSATATSPFDFKGATKAYTVYVANTAEKLQFTATERVEGQTFTAKVNGQSVPVTLVGTHSATTLDGSTIAAELVKGQNITVEITVTAPDAATSTTYTVNVVSAASGASAVATLKATPFTNVSPNVTISSTDGNNYSTATIDGNIASFKFKPEFTNAESRAVVSIGSTFYKPDADGVYTVDAATGTTAVKVTVVAGDNSTSTAYTLNIVKDATSLDLTAANAAKTAATTALSAYTTAGGLNTATVYTDVTTAVTALETAITSASATDIAAKTTALTTATTALTTATTVLTQGTALATALGYVNAAVPTLTGTTVTLPTTGGVTWTKGGVVVTTDTVSYGSSATTIEYVATATVSGQTATKTHTLTVPAKAVASVTAPTITTGATGADNATVLAALATSIGNVTVSNNDGTSGTVVITVANLSTTADLTTAGQKTIKVTVDGKEVTFTVNLTA